MQSRQIAISTLGAAAPVYELMVRFMSMQQMMDRQGGVPSEPK